ncbi:MAG: LLM class flavin-dependent oxidoreductase [Pseudomonadota bacterium]
MRIGISFAMADPAGLSRTRLVEDAQLIEQMGFHGQWFFDALGRGGILPDPLIALTTAACATERLEVGTCVLQVPLRRAAELAHRVLTAHLIAEGRMAFGVGAGSTATDFQLVGVDFEDRLRQLDESLDVMQALWRGETVNDVSLTPWPATIGGPPILIGSWSGSVWIPRAAQEFDGWIASGAKTSFNTLAGGIERFRSAGGKRAIVTNVAIDLDASTEALPDDGPFHLRCAPDEARRRFQRLADLGFDDCIFVLPDRNQARLNAIRDLMS